MEESKDKDGMKKWQKNSTKCFSTRKHFQTYRSYIQMIPPSHTRMTYFVLVLLLLLFPATVITVHPATPVVPPGVFTLPFLSAPIVVLSADAPDTGLFFLLPPPLVFFLTADTTVKVPPDSGELCVLGSSSWFRTLGRFFSPRALARAIASATMRFAFSCLHRISTRRTEAGSPGALVMRMAWDGVVVVEGPAVDVLITFTTETAPPAEDAELVCVKENV